MKLIKGTYERMLRSHECIEDYFFNIGDYYLQDEKDFTVSLNVIKLDENYTKEEVEEIGYYNCYEIKEVARFNINDIKNIPTKELKKIVKERG